MSRFDLVRAALDRLDHSNDDHWMPDGTPRLDALVHLEPLPTREEINKFSVTRRKPEPTPDVVESAPPMPALTPDEARAAIIEAENTLFVARQDVQRLAAKQKVDRAAASEAIENFRALWPRMTPEQNARQFIASSIEQRAEIAAQTQAPGPDVIQQQASATRGGSAAGRFNAWRRGADATSRMRGQKLPSQK